MDDRHVVGQAGLNATTSLPFQDHNNGCGEPTRSRGSSHLFYECSGCSRSVPPPAGRTRADDVRCINEKHSSSLTVTANCYGGGMSEAISGRQPGIGVAAGLSPRVRRSEIFRLALAGISGDPGHDGQG